MANNWTSASFNGNVLQTANILLKTIDHFSGPDTDAPLYKVAHANYSAQPKANWPGKPITLSGVIQSTVSIADLDNMLDTFKSYFTTSGNLDIDYNGGTRRYPCGVPTVKIDRPDGLLWANFTVTFYALSFGKSINSTNLLNATGRGQYVYAWTGTANASSSTKSTGGGTLLNTNLITNPSFEGGLTGWGVYGGSCPYFGGTSTTGPASLAAFNMGNSYTVIARVWLDTANTGWNAIFSGGNSADANAGSTFAINTDGRIGVGQFSASFATQSAGTGFPTGWHEVGATYSWDGVGTCTVTFWLDGAQVGASATYSLTTAPGNFTAPKIGAYAANNGAQFKGYMNYAYIYTGVLTNAQMAGTGRPTPAHQYNMNEGGGTTFNDNGTPGGVNATSFSGQWNLATITADTAQYQFGTQSLKSVSSMVIGGGGYAGSAYINFSGLTVGQTYTVSAYVKGNTAGSANAGNILIGAGSSNQQSFTITNSWQRFSVTFTPTSANGALYLRTSDTNYTTWWDGIQLEAGSSATTYFDGSFGTVNVTSYTDTVTFTGSAPFQLPIVTITYTGLTASGQQTVSWGNQANGQTISVTRAWTNGDILAIDTTQSTVTVNGLAVDYSGAFPSFSPGSQTFIYMDQFSYKAFNEVVALTPLYM